MKIFELSSYLGYQDEVRACTQRYVGTFYRSWLQQIPAGRSEARLDCGKDSSR
jgi:hypothetical protein